MDEKVQNRLTYWKKKYHNPKGIEKKNTHINYKHMTEVKRTKIMYHSKLIIKWVFNINNVVYIIVRRKKKLDDFFVSNIDRTFYTTRLSYLKAWN